MESERWKQIEERSVAAGELETDSRDALLRRTGRDEDLRPDTEDPVAREEASTQTEAPNLFSDYGFVVAKVVDEALKATDGDTSNKDRLAEAMVKVAFNAPRGPFRFDPETHEPVQNVYMLEEQRKGDRIVGNVIATVRDVRAPATKQLWEAR